VFSSWETAALFRLEAMRYAAAEAPLPAETREKLAARVRQARADVDTVGARYAAGYVRSAAARKTIDGLMDQLKADLAVLLGDLSMPFSERVDKTMGDAQLFADGNPERGQLILETSVKLDGSQKARAAALLSETATEVRDLERTNPPDMLARRHDLGFSTRAAIRAMLTPEQLRSFDGPFEAPAVAVRPPSTTPTTDPIRPTLSEAQAIALTRLEALRYAADEGPYSSDTKAALNAQISAGLTRVKEKPSTEPVSGIGSDDDRIGQIYANVLADASKTVLADTSGTLRDRAGDLIRRQGRIYQDVADLSTGEPWRGRAALDSLKLSASQEAQVDRILADCAQQLRALDAKASPPPWMIDPDPQPSRPPKEKYADFFASDPSLGPAARSLRRRRVAFEARAALHEVLTPQQQAQWDETPGN
jgi:hypothetical protein